MDAKTADAKPTGLTFRRYKDGDHKHRPWQEEIFQAGWSHKCPTYVHRTAPCQASCPSGHDIRGWLAIARGQDKPAQGTVWQEHAFRRMTSANPFPSVMGRVCPAPCEDGCNRNEVEDHVGINAVEHYVGDWALNQGLTFEAPGAESGKRIAVIGGGPAGLSAAFHLRRRGHAVVLFEEKPELGGMMRYGIPGYRTPRDVLDGEIKRILDLGVEVRAGVRVGRDVPVAQLEAEFDAIFWGIGTHEGRGLPVPGWKDTPNCVSGVGFLRAFNEGRLKGVTGKVIVVGGGDTSIDVASVARRIGHIQHAHEKDRPENVIFGQTAHDVADSAARGGAEVMLTSLFPVEKMTAAEQEVNDAKREGVDIRGSVMPLEVVKGPDGRAVALKLCKCEMDGQVPRPVAGTEFEVECDLIVAAIGQKGDMDGLEAFDNGKGFINADKLLRVPGKPKHFVGGDIVRPHLLTTAIGHGRIAAESIEHFLAGVEDDRRPRVDVVHFDLIDRMNVAGIAPEPFTPDQGGGRRGTSEARFAVHNYEDRGKHEVITHEELFLGHFLHTPRNVRSHVEIGAEEVLGNFQERLVPLTEEQVVVEGKRCMSCGMCFECDNCVIFCPQDAVSRTPKAARATGRYVQTDYTKCIGCHVCNDVCPTGYIQMGLGE
ncbi:NAD(P)-binding protein [Azospirillum sp.]|uniref:NAD(P)-binding protein n=1 Tax=Azospirillum sp. TaxID=34012 RepID=UPI002D63C6FB|nr:NAD(P)-binding protein [Azospirillum sp.]HYD68973.1 NAD(P)-binding protein [Azospirillum sp.]